ncbi:hypothetical protein NQ314_010512 [Rhamnusium bicolor]|uniref:Uncharacterized protein n=1 Tax=Rhamnusium bicolor TaxID=1586634 RepID=A0AAV8XQ24_9CUCU|nr:hypothetical protein NQ314_010512 [Rhamnusium bicolor]
MSDNLKVTSLKKKLIETMLTSSGSDVLKENNNNNGSTSNLNHLSSPSANKDKEEQCQHFLKATVLKIIERGGTEI